MAHGDAGAMQEIIERAIQRHREADESRKAYETIEGVRYEVGTDEWAAARAAWQARTEEAFEQERQWWEEHRPLSAEEALAAIIESVPYVTAARPDALALHMGPYLPAFDSTQTYSLGTLVVKDGKIMRKVSVLMGDWIVVGELAATPLLDAIRQIVGGGRS